MFRGCLMLPAHLHDVTYDHFWTKILQELTKSPTRNTRAIFETLKSKSYEQCRTKQEYYNNKAPHFYQLDYRFFRSDKSFEHVQNHTSFHEFY